MSDLSMPPLGLVQPPDGTAAAAVAPAPFDWPVPPDPSYPAHAPLGLTQPCELEGPNGRVSTGQLLTLDPVAGTVQVQMSHKAPLTLRFAQFRRLTLLQPLKPRPLDPEKTTPLLPLRGLAECRLSFRDGPTIRIDSVGHVDLPIGVFSFRPVDTDGGVERSFFPRARLARARLGPRRTDHPSESLGFDLDAVDDEADEAPTVPMPLDLSGAPASPARPAGELLPEQQITTAEQLLQAIEQQARMPMVRIGEALLALGLITEAKLGDALQAQLHDRSLPLGELLVRRGDVSRADLQTALARKMGYPIIDAHQFPVEPDAALRLPVGLARRLVALPLLLRPGRLVVALEDPSARHAIDEIEFSTQLKVVTVLARAATLPAAIERVYARLGQDAIEPSSDLVGGFGPYGDDGGDTANKLLANLEQQLPSQPPSRDDEPQIEQSDNSLVRLINQMILEAKQQGVSDIHIECQPGQEKVRVRFRRDGVLRNYIELPHTYRNALVGRLKIMCDLDISERRKPQDGKINFGRWVQGQRLELRVATIPTANGLEDVVMRLLASARALPLDAMGIAPDTLHKLRTVIERPYGMVLCVGPTGSGKTTTLHAALSHINTPERKIWTAEDPVEITQPGLRQVQVNPKIDWTFAKALRAFLRADPDVVMIGEIRDRETAQMAVEASLTGHLVLSTLHTNSAPETVTRLLDMGMDPFSFADSLLAVLAQRLVRRWCRHCVTRTPATAAEVDALLDEYLQAYPVAADQPERDALRTRWLDEFGVDGALHHHYAPGCGHCTDSGFAGRVGLHELLVVNRELRHLVQTNARAEDLQAAAMREGMRTLRQDGLLKVLAGQTSIEEVRATSNG